MNRGKSACACGAWLLITCAACPLAAQTTQAAPPDAAAAPPSRPSPAALTSAGHELRDSLAIEPAGTGFVDSLTITIRTARDVPGDVVVGVADWPANAPSNVCEGSPPRWSTYSRPFELRRSAVVWARSRSTGLTACETYENLDGVHLQAPGEDRASPPKAIADTPAERRLDGRWASSYAPKLAVDFRVVHDDGYAALAFEPDLLIQPAEGMRLGLEMPFGIGFPGPSLDPARTPRKDVTTRWLFGNPSLAFGLVRASRTGASGLFGAVRLTAPVQNGEPGTPDARAAHLALVVENAGSRPYRFSGGYLPASITGAAEGMGATFYGRLELTATGLLPIMGRSGETPRAVFEAIAEGAVRSAWSGARVMVGARMQGTYGNQSPERLALVPDKEGSDWVHQLALDPFLGVDARPSLFRLGVLMPLDEPLGFAFDGTKLYVVHLSLTRQL